MDTRKFELDALSDGQLDAVSGGDMAAMEEAQKAIEAKVQSSALTGFQKLLQSL
jgi:hypothetical protein